jgi:hypothetical protein
VPVSSDGGDAGILCRANAECVNGHNGRCSYCRVSLFSPFPLTTDLCCTYDECQTDADCNGGVCACGRDTTPPYNHYCVAGNCRIDSDCGGQYCSPSVPLGCGNHYRYVGFYCHTASDECSQDSDCPATPGSQSPYCAYDPVVSHWACSSRICPG